VSRTDVHRPYRVQVTDPYNQHRMLWRPNWGWGNGRGLEPWPLYNTCGCNLCVGQLYRKHLRQQERGAWRQVRQGLLKTQAADREDMDWYAPVSVSW
jgi:hypothetical protein